MVIAVNNRSKNSVPENVKKRVARCPNWVGDIVMATPFLDCLMANLLNASMAAIVRRFSRGKCGFKILQYFASGLPVIASPVGVNEKFLTESKAGMLAATAEEWKSAIEKTVNDPNL